jgi:hypothetical protein
LEPKLTRNVEVACGGPPEVDDGPAVQRDIVREQIGEFLEDDVRVGGRHFPEALADGLLERLAHAADLQLAVIDLQEEARAECGVL